MRIKFTLGLALALCCARTNCFGAADTIQVQFEQMARTYSHFSLPVVIQNQPLRPWPPIKEVKTVTNDLAIRKPETNTLRARQPWLAYNALIAQNNALAEEQLRLVKELRAASGNREILAALLKLPSPKVRTLALGAIFEREDGRDLPLIASLIDDPAPTFPNLHESMSSMGGAHPLSEMENTQTVGDVTQAMLAFWGVRHDGRLLGIGFGGRIGLTTNDFAEYWKTYAGREYCASWFEVKMRRATRQTTPIQPECRTDIQRVLAEMKALPMPDRAWTQLYVLNEGWSGLTDDELITVTRKLSPESLLRFLQRQKISDDPDLLMVKRNSEFVRISNFILRHADQLLRPEDADPLLACQDAERDPSGVNPAWSIGAALVQPVRASEILHNALARETRSYETAAGQLAGALWRLRGPTELDFLINWLYTVLPAASEPMHQPVAFLREVEAAARPDTKQLIAALVKDSRFDCTDWETLKELLNIVNAGRSAPLVNEREIYDARTGALANQRLVLATWRNLLRREHGLPEKPLPTPETRPKQVLLLPAWSVPLPNPVAQIVPSPDGKWLAVLTNGTITFWKAASGEIGWKISLYRRPHA